MVSFLISGYLINIKLNRYLIILIALFMFVMSGWTSVGAQNRCLSGRVVDRDSGESVRDAHVWENTLSVGSVTDSSGYFKICLPDDLEQALLTVSHASFETQRIVVEDFSKETFVIVLERKDLLQSEVQIVRRRKAVINDILPGQHLITGSDISRMPSFLGEADVVRTLQQSPGVQSVSEGIGGVYVRGGGPGQNGIFLDGMELMNPVHLMGLFSVFNPITTNKVELFKGHNPSFLRGGLSSSILVSSVDPIQDENFVSGSVGNIATNLAFAQRSKNGRFGVTVGFRRSYLELYRGVSGLFVDEEKNYFERSFYRFYDFNGRISYHPADRTSFYLSWYLGKDDFMIDDEEIGYDAGTNYGNKAFALEWRQRTGTNSILSAKASWTGTWSDFDGEIIDNDLLFQSSYDKYSVGVMMTSEQSGHLIRAGMDASWHQTVPQDMEMELMNDIRTADDEFRSADVSGFVEDTWDVSPMLSVSAGFRGIWYFNLGPYQYEGLNKLEVAPSNEIVDREFYGIPSVSVLLRFPARDEVRFAWTRNVQLMHLATLSTMPLPNDIWMMSSPKLAPQTGHLWSVEYSLRSGDYEFSSGAFGRLLENQLVFNVNTEEEEMNFEDHFFHGKGRSYGVELSARKTKGRFQGSLNYTLSRSERSFPDIFSGEWFPDKFDRTHDLSLSTSFRVNDRWTFNTSWIYATGNNMTLPAGRMWMMGSVMNDYAGYNNFRLPAYHRLDMSASMKLDSDIFRESVLDFSIINVYNRANPYFVFYRVYQGDSNYDIDIRAAQVSLFPVMPSVSWKFKF